MMHRVPVLRHTFACELVPFIEQEYVFHFGTRFDGKVAHLVGPNGETYEEIVDATCDEDGGVDLNACSIVDGLPSGGEQHGREFLDGLASGSDHDRFSGGFED